MLFPYIVVTVIDFFIAVIASNAKQSSYKFSGLPRLLTLARNDDICLRGKA
jgi:hypothetical protein